MNFNNHKTVDFYAYSMGYNFKTPEDLTDYMEGLFHSEIFYFKPCDYGHYTVLEPGAGIEIWNAFATDETLANNNFFVRTPNLRKILLRDWVGKTASNLSGLANVSFICSHGFELPLNLDVVNSGAFADYTGGEFDAQICAFPKVIELFKSETDYENSDHKLPEDTIIPVGADHSFAEEGDDWTPSPIILFNGKILAVKPFENPHTGKDCTLLTISSMGLVFDMVFRGKRIDHIKPRPGNIVQGGAILLARFFKSENDEQIRRLGYIDTNAEGEDGFVYHSHQLLSDKSLAVIYEKPQAEIAGELSNGENPDPDSEPYTYLIKFYSPRLEYIKSKKIFSNGKLCKIALGPSGELNIVSKYDYDDDYYMWTPKKSVEYIHMDDIDEDFKSFVIDGDGNKYLCFDSSEYASFYNSAIDIYDKKNEFVISRGGEGIACFNALTLTEDGRPLVCEAPSGRILKLEEFTKGFTRFSELELHANGLTGMAISPDEDSILFEYNKTRYYIWNKGDISGQLRLVELNTSFDRPVYGSYGAGSFMKDRFTIVNNGIINVFSLENKYLKSLSHLGRIRTKADEGTLYVVDTDFRMVSDEDFNDYLAPKLFELRDMKGEYLVITHCADELPCKIEYMYCSAKGEDYDKRYFLELGFKDDSGNYPNIVRRRSGIDIQELDEIYYDILIRHRLPDLSEFEDATESLFGKR